MVSDNLNNESQKQKQKTFGRYLGKKVIVVLCGFFKGLWAGVSGFIAIGIISVIIVCILNGLGRLALYLFPRVDNPDYTAFGALTLFLILVVYTILIGFHKLYKFCVKFWKDYKNWKIIGE